MPLTRVSSRDFQQHTSRAQSATKNGPVIITKRGQPAQVLLSFEDYERLSGHSRTIVDALSMSDLGEVELEPPRSAVSPRAADLS